MGQCIQLRTDRVVSVEQIRRATEGWSIEVTPAVAKKIDRFAANQVGFDSSMTFNFPCPYPEISTRSRLHKKVARGSTQSTLKEIWDPPQIWELSDHFKSLGFQDEWVDLPIQPSARSPLGDCTGFSKAFVADPRII